MAVRCSSSFARRGALALAAGALALLGGCVVAPIDPYYEVGAPMVVQPGPSYGYSTPYYAAPYYGGPYWQRPYYAAPPVSIGIWGHVGGGYRHGHRHRPGRHGFRR